LPAAAVLPPARPARAAIFFADKTLETANAEKQVGAWLGRSYFRAIYDAEPQDIILVDSWDLVFARLWDYSEIEHVGILSHAGSTDIVINHNHLTPEQFAIKLSERPAPRIAMLSIEGCNAGTRSAKLFAMASALGIAEVRAFNYHFHFDRYIKTQKPGTSPEDLAIMHAELERAVPYLPRVENGRRGTYDVAELEARLASNGRIDVMSEYFAHGYYPKPFHTLVATSAPQDSRYVPRGLVEDRVMTDAAAATAFDANDADGTIAYRVVIRARTTTISP
jgi:hypothetical protein